MRRFWSVLLVWGLPPRDDCAEKNESFLEARAEDCWEVWVQTAAVSVFTVWTDLDFPGVGSVWVSTLIRRQLSQFSGAVALRRCSDRDLEDFAPQLCSLVDLLGGTVASVVLSGPVALLAEQVQRALSGGLCGTGRLMTLGSWT